MGSELINSDSLHLTGYYASFKKSTDVFSPIFEAISNAWESFPETQEDRNIVLNIRYEKLLDVDVRNVDQIEVQDNGIGFNEENYQRFIRFNDNRKSSKNKGTGRVQFLKFFESYKIVSTYEENNKRYTRNIFSSQDYVNDNILLKAETLNSCNHDVGSTITFSKFISEKDGEKFASYSLEEIKDKILHHFLLKGATVINPPIITIAEDGGEKCIIDKSEYTKPKKAYFSVPVYDENVQIIEDRQLCLDIFKFSKNICKHNQLFVSSKGEYVKELNMSCMKDKDTLDGYFFVVAVNGELLDKFVNDQRNDILLPTKNKPYFPGLGAVPFFYYEDLEEHANKAILDCCPEIKEFAERQRKQVDEIVAEFNIKSEVLEKANIKNNDSTDKILKKCYKVESEISANKDSKVFDLKKKIKELNPNSDGYQKKLSELADELNDTISLQNKEHLSRYISRRKIVLDLLESILNHSQEIQDKAIRNQNEALLHNTLFRKGNNNPLLSDLWVLDEAAIYFNGVSEQKLENVEYDGKPLFDANIKDDELYWDKNKARRPDILLFPSEGKCIIIEYKTPDVPIENYLGQGPRYAALINTYSRNDVVFRQFYIYLIGEGYSYRDVVSADSAYTQLPSSSILFKNAPVADLNNPENRTASGYYEVLNYSSLIERAKNRNKIFFDKLFNNDSESGHLFD